MENNLKEKIGGLVKIVQGLQEPKGHVNYREVDVSYGARYAKLYFMNAYGGGRSVHCFVDMTNGDILKASSWSAPAKGARGNVFNENGGKSAVTRYGAIYMR